MNYQLTCLCGHRFLIPENQLSQATRCPACNRALMPIASPGGAAPPASTAPAMTADDALLMAADPTKRCPFCGEVILAIAKKCKHCGEFLDRSPPPGHPADHTPAGLVPPSAAASPLAPLNGADVPPIYSLSVSQWDNFWRYLICVCVAILAGSAFWFIPPLKPFLALGITGIAVLLAFVIWLLYLSVRNSRCYIRPMRIDTETGILSKDLDSIELFRISDLELKQSLLERLLRIGTIRIFSTDATNPDLTLYQIPKAREIYTYLQNQIPLAVKQRGAYYIEK